jgi:hypothetical protein
MLEEPSENQSEVFGSPSPVKGGRGLRTKRTIAALIVAAVAVAFLVKVLSAPAPTTKTASDLPIEPPLTAAERAQIVAVPLGTSDISASTGSISNLLVSQLQVSTTAVIQGDLTVGGNGTFTGTITASNFAGSGSGMTGVDAALLNGKPGSYYAGLAANVSSLSSNAALLGSNNTFSQENKFTTGITAGSVADSGPFEVSGSANLSGVTSISSLTLGAPLQVSSGGTGVSSVPDGAVLYGQGGQSLGTAVPSAAGLCLLSGATAVQWGSCSTAAPGVATVNNLSGALTIADANGAGTTITIQDATTVQKGISSFNATNFTVVAGAVNTVQGISAGSSPTFAGINTNSITPSAALTVGATSQNLTIQGATTTITSTNGANKDQLEFVAPTANVTYRLQTAAAGTYDVCTTAGNCVGAGGSVSTAGGAAGDIPKYTSASALAPSLLTDNGTVVTDTGNLSVTGTVALTNALSVLNGGTGATTAASARGNLGAAASGANADITQLSGLTTALTVLQGGSGATTLTANGVLLGNGTSPISSIAAASAGDCLVSTAGAPVWTACPDGAEVDTLDNLSGALTIADSSGVGSTVTIQDASTAQKGIAKFNATNFTAAAGTIDTIQDIATTSAPTFGQLTLTSGQAVAEMLTVNNTNTSATGNLVDLQVNAISKFSVTPSGNLTTAGTITSGTVNGQAISSSAAFTGTLGVTGLATFNGGATVVGALTTNSVTPTAALTVGVAGQSFTLQGNGSSTVTSTAGGKTTTVAFQSPTANVTYNFDTAAAGTYDICSTAGNCAGTGGGVTTAGGISGKLAKFTGAQTLASSSISDSGTSVTVTPSSDSATVFQVQNAAGRSLLNVDTTADKTTLGNITASAGQGVAGSLVLADGTADNFGLMLSSATLSSNRTITLPDAAGTVAVSASGPLSLDAHGNITCPTCVTSGGGGGGIAAVDSVDVLTGALTIADSTGAGTTITIQDASTAQKGLAEFNSTNFTSAAGVINTIQDISTSSAPSFGQLALSSSQAAAEMLTVNNTNAAASGDLIDLKLNGNSEFSVTPAGNLSTGGTVTSGAVNGQTISSAANFTGTIAAAGLATLSGGATVSGTLTANTITPNGAFTAGSTGQQFTLQGNASSTITATGGGFTTTIGFSGSPTAAVAYDFDRTAPVGTYTVCTTAGNCVGTGGSVSTSGGAAGDIPKYTSGSALGPSLLTDNGALVTDAGNLSVSGTVAFSNQLTVANGGTGANSLASNGVLLGNGSSAISSLVAGASGDCLVSTAGSPTFQTCPGVSTLDNLGGALTVADSTGSGTTVTIQNASTGQLGLAEFNATNFTTAAGVVNTIQNIATTSAPSFGQLSLSSGQATAEMFTVNNTNAAGTGDLIDLQTGGISQFSITPAGNLSTNGTITSGTINGQTISSTAAFTGTVAVTGLASLNGGATVGGTLTANTITPTSALTIGATGQQLSLQGNASSTISATGGGFTTNIGFNGTPTGTVAYNFDRSAAAGTYTICSTAGNCTGSGGISGSGTANKIAKFTSSGAIGDSSISDTGSSVTVQSGTDSTTAFQVKNAAGSNTLLSIDSTNSAVTLGTTNGAATTSIYGGSGGVFVQGGTGGVAINTGSGAGTTAGITLQTGDSSGGDSGNITIDNGANVPGGTQIEDDTFETSTDNYGDYIGLSSVTQSSAQAHTGSDSLKLVETGTGTWSTMANSLGFPVTPGHVYSFTAWVRAGTAGETVLGQTYWVNGSIPGSQWDSATDTTSGWTELTGTATAPPENPGAGSEFEDMQFSGPNGNTGQILYIDDVTVTDESSITAPSINIGAANAQAINIGSLSQYGITSVTGGGGVNVAAGSTGTINIGTSSSMSNDVNIGNTGGGATTLIGSGVTQTLNSSGNDIIQSTTNSTQAFQVQNSAGSSLLTTDTINTAIVLGQDNTPTALTVRGGAASGTDDNGANITFDASNGTGAGGSGSLIFRTAKPTGNAIALDNSDNMSGGYPANATLSFATGTQSDRLLIVTDITCTSDSYTSVTYNGINLTQLSTATAASGPHVEMWYLLNPPSGTHDIIATLSDNGCGRLIGASTYYNVDQSTPFGTVATSTGTGTNDSSLNVATTSTAQIVVDGLGSDGADPVNYLGGQTQIWNQPPNGGDWPAAGAEQAGTGGTVNMSWDVGSADWADIGVPLNPVANTTADSLTDTLDLAPSGDVGIDNENPTHTLEVSGNASFQNASDSTNAFQIQDAAGTSNLLVADTTDNRVGIGTATPSQLLEVSGGNAQVTNGNLNVNYGGVDVSGIAPPNTAVTANTTGSGVLNGTYYYYVSYLTQSGETTVGPNATSVTPASQQVALTNIPIGPAGVIGRRIYRSPGNPPWPYTGYLLTTINDNTTTTYTDNAPDSSLGAPQPTYNTTSFISNPQGEANGEAFGSAATLGPCSDETAIGNSAVAGWCDTTALGQDAVAANSGATSVGSGSLSAFQGTALGTQTTAYQGGTSVGEIATTGNYAVAIGYSSTANSNDSIALGAGATTTNTNQLVIGGSLSAGSYIQDAYIGSGVTDTSPQSITLHATGSSASGVAGANLTLDGGDATTGNSDGGNVLLQGGVAHGTGTSGSTAISTQNNTGNTGSIILQSGNSSGGTSGNVSLDTGASSVSSGANIEDDTFESGLDGWTNQYTTTVAQSAAQAHGGTHSMGITSTASTGWAVGGPYPGAYVTAGQLYNFSAWVRGTSSENVRMYVFWTGGAGGYAVIGSVTDSTTGWTQISGSAAAPAGATNVELFLNGIDAGGVTTYADDITVDGGTSTPAVLIGSTNAAALLLGNANEVGATTLQGGSGGVNVTASTGNITIGQTPLSGSTFGYTGTGNNTGGCAGTCLSGSKFTTTAGGTIGSMSVYYSNPNSGDQYAYAVYSDSAGAPGSYIASSGVGTFGSGGPGWYTLPITATLAPSTTYWLVFNASGGPGINFYTGVGASDSNNTSYAFHSGPDNGFPATWPGGTGFTGLNGSVYATYTSGSVANLTIDPLGRLAATGQATFESANDSASAFQVQDAGTNNLLAVDTAGDIVSVGATGSTALASTVNIATSTGAAQTVSLGSGSSTSATVVNGGTGGVAVSTGAGSGTTGSINISTGNSSTTAAGNISIDTGTSVQTGGTQVEDKTFELGINNMNCWFNCGATSSTTAQAHLGTHSLALPEDGAGDTWGLIEDYPGAVTAVPGHSYAFSAWVRGTTSESINGGVNWPGSPSGQTDYAVGVTDSTTAWTQLSGTLVAPFGATNVYFTFSGSGSGTSAQTDYFDDLTVTDLGLIITPSISIGATNAQTLTVGNLNQGGYTYLYGGGDGIQIQTAGDGTVAIGTENGATVQIGGVGSGYGNSEVDIADTSNADQLVNIGGTDSSGGSSTHTQVNLQGGQTAETVANAGVNIQSFTNSTTAFSVQNAAAVTVLNVDTTNSTVSVRAATNDGVTLAVDNSDGTPSIEVRAGGSGSYSTFIGVNSGANNTFSGANGFQNTGVGNGALTANTTGSYNTGLGVYTLHANMAGSYDTAIGNGSVQSLNNAASTFDTGVGNNSLNNLQNGASNTAVGSYALYYDNSNKNTAIGAWALTPPDTLSTAEYDTALGYYAGASDDDGFYTPGSIQGSTAIGYEAQVQANNSLVLGDSGQNSVKVGIGTTIPTNTFSVSPVYYSSGSANVGSAGTTVTGVGTTWTSAMVGMQFIFMNGQSGIITAVGSTTSLTLSVSQPITATLHYRIQDIGFQVTSAGSAYVQNTSTTAFQIQTSSGTALLTADTTNMKVTVTNLEVSLNLTVDGHIITGGTAPTIAAGTAACTTPTVSLSGTDTAGLITVTTGSACSPVGKLATITFNTAFGAAPRVTLTPADATATGLTYYVDSSTISTASFDLDTNTAPANTTTYKWYYHVIQ